MVRVHKGGNVFSLESQKAKEGWRFTRGVKIIKIRQQERRREMKMIFQVSVAQRVQVSLHCPASGHRHLRPGLQENCLLKYTAEPMSGNCPQPNGSVSPKAMSTCTLCMVSVTVENQPPELNVRRLCRPGHLRSP